MPDGYEPFFPPCPRHVTAEERREKEKVIDLLRGLSPRVQALVLWEQILDPTSLVGQLVEKLGELYRAIQEGNQQVLAQNRKLFDHLLKRKPEFRRDLEIVRLRDEEGWTFRQIADHFDMESDAVRRAYWRIKKDLASGE
jgi:DNA-directed RNA polymerase specialized sigma24 family protein